MSKRDYYDVLGVGKSSSQDEIKKAYRKVALKYHPDRNPDDKDAEDKFKEAAEAYDVLGNEEKRRKYDQFGHQAFGAGAGGGGFHGNMNDIFDMFGDIFGGGGGGGFGGFGGFGGGGRARQAKGSNLRIKVKLTFEEVANGVEKKIKIRRAKIADGVTFKTCSTCNGAGQVQQVTNTILGQMRTAATCSSCSGSGKVVDQKPSGVGSDGLDRQEEVVSVKIPAGVDTGDRVRLSGEGEAGVSSGPAGDLYVQVNVKDHRIFTRDGKDLYCEVPISFTDAALGGELEVPTLDGRVKLKIPDGTQTGKLFRVRAKGVKPVRGGAQGDLLCRVSVETPVNLTAKQRELLEELHQTLNHKTHAPKREGWFDSVKSFFDEMKF